MNLIIREGNKQLITQGTTLGQKEERVLLKLISVLSLNSFNYKFRLLYSGVDGAEATISSVPAEEAIQELGSM